MIIKVIFVVVKLDRFSHKMSSLLNILEKLKTNNMEFKSIKDDIDNTSIPTGILMMQLLAMLNDTLRVRTRKGLNKARLDGKFLGAPSIEDKIKDKLYCNIDISVKQVVSHCDVSERTVYRITNNRNLS